MHDEPPVQRSMGMTTLPLPGTGQDISLQMLAEVVKQQQVFVCMGIVDCRPVARHTG